MDSMATKPTQERDPKHKTVHVAKNDVSGKPEVPEPEYWTELDKASGDNVTWLKANSNAPGFKIVFDYDEGSPFASKEFSDGESNDQIVVQSGSFRYTVYYANGKSLDPGIIIR